MRAREHTQAMVHFYHHHRITTVDLAVRRREGTFLYQYRQRLDALPIAWLRAENVRHADAYLRPARDQHWPMVFLDDVIPTRALQVASRYGALVVQTSSLGGCHLWLALTQALNQHQRYQVQRWLIPRLDADPGSVSGEHLGRLAGLRNWKRSGCWVNVLNPYPAPRPPWNPAPALADQSLASTITDQRSQTTNPNHHRARDLSPSAKEWGWVCGALQAGIKPDIVYQKLLQRTSARRGSDAERYARYTLQRALQQLR